MNNVPIIYQPLKNAKRIKIYIPYELKELREVFKKINTTFWHPNQKLWSIIYTQENLALIKELFMFIHLKLKNTWTPTFNTLKNQGNT